MVDVVADQVLGLAPICPLQRCKTTNIKRLQEVRRVSRHTNSDNLVIFAVLLETERVITLVAFDNEQAYCANSPLLCMSIKVL